MTRKRKVYHPYDFASTVNYDEFPKESLLSLGVPGKFEKRLSRKVHVRSIEDEADAIYIAQADGKELKQRSTVVLENLSKKMDYKKGTTMGRYVKHAHLQTSLPVFPVVASKYNHITEEKYYEIDPRILMNPFLLNLDEEYTRKKLNNVKNKLNNSNELSVETGMDLCNAIIYAPPNQEIETLNEAIDYYLGFEIKNPRLRFALFSSFYCMTDAYIDDENEFEELIEMIKQKQTPETLDNLTTLVNSQNNLALARELLAEKDDEIAEQNKTITEQNTEIAEQNKKLTEDEYIFSKLRKLADRLDDDEISAEIYKILFKTSPTK